EAAYEALVDAKGTHEKAELAAELALLHRAEVIVEGPVPKRTTAPAAKTVVDEHEVERHRHTETDDDPDQDDDEDPCDDEARSQAASAPSTKAALPKDEREML